MYRSREFHVPYPCAWAQDNQVHYMLSLFVLFVTLLRHGYAQDCGGVRDYVQKRISGTCIY